MGARTHGRDSARRSEEIEPISSTAIPAARDGTPRVFGARCTARAPRQRATASSTLFPRPAKGQVWARPAWAGPCRGSHPGLDPGEQGGGQRGRGRGGSRSFFRTDAVRTSSPAGQGEQITRSGWQTGTSSEAARSGLPTAGARPLEELVSARVITSRGRRSLPFQSARPVFRVARRSASTFLSHRGNPRSGAVRPGIAEGSRGHRRMVDWEQKGSQASDLFVSRRRRGRNPPPRREIGRLEAPPTAPRPPSPTGRKAPSPRPRGTSPPAAGGQRAPPTPRAPSSPAPNAPGPTHAGDSEVPAEGFQGLR